MVKQLYEENILNLHQFLFTVQNIELIFKRTRGEEQPCGPAIAASIDAVPRAPCRPRKPHLSWEIIAAPPEANWDCGWEKAVPARSSSHFECPVLQERAMHQGLIKQNGSTKVEPF